MAKIGNELKFLLFIVNLSKPNKPVNGFAVAAESHAATRLPAFAPQNCLSHSLPRFATGHIQTRCSTYEETYEQNFNITTFNINYNFL